MRGCDPPISEPLLAGETIWLMPAETLPSSAPAPQAVFSSPYSASKKCSDDIKNRPKYVFLSQGKSFGQGGHPSTVGCIEAIEWLHKKGMIQGKCVLDAGTGSGVLGLTALKLGASRVIGIDIDAQAIREAKDNRSLNSVDHDRFILALASCLHIRITSFQVILLNVVPSVRHLFFRCHTQGFRKGQLLVISGQKGLNKQMDTNGPNLPTMETLNVIDVNGWKTIVLQVLEVI